MLSRPFYKYIPSISSLQCLLNLATDAEVTFFTINGAKQRYSEEGNTLGKGEINSSFMSDISLTLDNLFQLLVLKIYHDFTSCQNTKVRKLNRYKNCHRD